MSASQERIIALMSQLPDFYSRIPVEIRKDFDAEAFDDWGFNNSISKNEYILVRFFLMIWDSNNQWKCGKFFIDEAFLSLDPTSKELIQTWCQKPFFL